MKNQREIVIRYTMLVTALLIMYFLSLAVSGYLKHIELKLLFILILGAGIGFGMRDLRLKLKGKLYYFEGIKLGVRISLLAMGLFAAFCWAFFKFVSPEMIMEMNGANGPAGSLYPELEALLVFIVGSVSGLVMTFILLQYLRYPIKYLRTSTANES